MFAHDVIPLMILFGCFWLDLLAYVDSYKKQDKLKSTLKLFLWRRVNSYFVLTQPLLDYTNSL